MADKGGAIVFIIKENYISACEDVFRDKRFYEETKIDSNLYYRKKLEKIISEMKVNSFINETESNTC